MIRVGILGYSDIARRKFIPALLKSSQACCTALARRRQNAGSPELQLDVVTYEELAAAADIDLVYLSLPNHLHEHWCIRCLERGKHVICEKPLSLSGASASRMLEAAECNGRLLYENLMYLQHPQHRMVKSLIDAGRIGSLVSLHSEFAFPGPAAGDFRLDPSCGGGAFHDMSRYPLSAAQHFLTGNSYRFETGSSDVHNGLVRSLWAEAVTDRAERFTFLTAFGQSYRSFYEIHGTLGTLRVDRAYTTPADLENVITMKLNDREEMFRVPPFDHFLGTIDHVCGLIRSGAWSREHQRSAKLAALADMFLAACPEKGDGHGIA